MRELTVKEMEIVSGGVWGLVIRGVAAGGRALMTPAGSNAAAGAGGYVTYSYLSGSKPTVAGAVAAGTMGGAVGALGKTTVGFTFGVPAATGALEGGLNGKSPLLNKSQDQSGNDYDNANEDGNAYGG